jgi:hypothetical protein
LDPLSIYVTLVKVLDVFSKNPPIFLKNIFTPMHRDRPQRPRPSTELRLVERDGRRTCDMEATDEMKML